ncbi:MAG: phospho-sugar mutase [Eggerthellaceae bacterium]|nr:phospho-sugar mutase [Eggerthellaceae bacterium]
MRDTHKLFQLWLENAHIADIAEDLHALKIEGEQAIEDAFFDDLKFGTAGLRGVIGAGTARMNEYTIGRATHALACYLKKHFESPSVVICRDSRNKGETFVKHVASVLAHHGIKSIIFPRIEPTPTLSFAVRHLKASAGINITASHNPAKYNGYKVYGQDGCQITEQAADEISCAMQQTNIFCDVKTMDFDEGIQQGLISWVHDDVISAYIRSVVAQVGLNNEDSLLKQKLSVLYTPLHGTGLECIKKAYKHLPYVNLEVVHTQEKPNGNFPTCPNPNPELRGAFYEAFAQVHAGQMSPDIIIATDPDADRVAVALSLRAEKNEFRILTGNEQGLLLMDYLAQRVRDAGDDISEKVALTTIVSSPLADDIAQSYGFELRRVLTGFKYIGEQMQLLEDEGRLDAFLLGYEESYGYLVGTEVRDKDAIVAAALFAEMAYTYKQRGLTLLQVIDGLYEKYGTHLSETLSFAFDGAKGAEHMASIMNDIRSNHPAYIGNLAVHEVVDYMRPTPMPCISARGASRATDATAPQTLPISNVLQFNLEQQARLIIRPSGTEPKIKAYVFTRAENFMKAHGVQGELKTYLQKLFSE